VKHPRRWRHSAGSRGMAFWLVVAQLTLFAASGLTHAHAISTGVSEVAAAPQPGQSVSPQACLAPRRVAHRHETSPCAICQSVRSIVVSLASVPDLTSVPAPGGPAAPVRRTALRSALRTPRSARAPPSETPHLYA
jgi:hypothetical protein